MNLVGRVFALVIAVVFSHNLWALEDPASTLSASYVFTIEAKISVPIAMGETVDGSRQSIPITGGKFYGEGISGHVLPGGADYQVTRSDGSTLLNAVYMMQTDDGALINVENMGLIVPPTEGRPGYFRTAPIFTAPNGKYSWLNQAIFVGGVRGAPKIPNTVFIDIYKLD